MSSQAQSEQNIARDHRPYTFSPLPQHEAQEDLESNLGSNGSRDDCSIRLGTWDIVLIIALILEIIYLTSYYLLDQGFRPHDPTLNSESFLVSKFNVSDTHLITAIDVDITFGCKDCDYKTFFDRIRCTIFYKGDTAFSTASPASFGLGKKELKTLKLKFATSWEDCPMMERIMDKHTLKEMEQDLKNGTMLLRLNIVNEVNFEKWGLTFYGASPGVYYNCWDLAVKFSATSGVGRLIRGAKKPYC